MKPGRFKVSIVYDDLNAELHAKEVADRVVSQFNGECDSECNLWKFELLGHALLRGEASNEASDADMIILACHDAELPSPIKSWVESAMMNRTNPGAFVALLSSEEATESKNAPGLPPVALYLRNAARHGGLDFFCEYDGEWHESINHGSTTATTQPAMAPVTSFTEIGYDLSVGAAFGQRAYQ